MKLKQRGVLITGCNRGLGKAIAKACVAQGADVLLCARDEVSLRQVVPELAEMAGSSSRILTASADVRDAVAVRKAVTRAAEELPDFCGLVNNAGIWGPKGLIEDVDLEEWRRAIEVNLFGPVYACRAAVPVFRKKGYGKIVNLSGGGATAPMPRLSAYSAGKAAVVRFTETLAGEVRDAGIDVNVVAPGALNTAMLDEILAAGPEKTGDYYQRAVKQKETGGSSLERAAALCVHLLSAETDGITGRLISAVWDPWERLKEFGEALAPSDVYTLRRIIPSERGFDWDKTS
jgi:NAD(P)-dependent dehydrogenase (short-subunit alcohol dehydrogenase family)